MSCSAVPREASRWVEPLYDSVFLPEIFEIVFAYLSSEDFLEPKGMFAWGAVDLTDRYRQRLEAIYARGWMQENKSALALLADAKWEPLLLSDKMQDTARKAIRSFICAVQARRLNTVQRWVSDPETCRSLSAIGLRYELSEWAMDQAVRIAPSTLYSPPESGRPFNLAPLVELLLHTAPNPWLYDLFAHHEPLMRSRPCLEWLTQSLTESPVEGASQRRVFLSSEYYAGTMGLTVSDLDGKLPKIFWMALKTRQLHLVTTILTNRTLLGLLPVSTLRGARYWAWKCVSRELAKNLIQVIRFRQQGLSPEEEHRISHQRSAAFFASAPVFVISSALIKFLVWGHA